MKVNALKMTIIKRGLLVLLCSQLPLSLLHAQDDEETVPEQDGKSFYAGFNFGGVLANRYTATYYNGFGNGGYTVANLLSNSIIYNQIYNQYGQNFQIGELPANPKYRVGLAIGGNLGMYLNETTALYINGDFARLNVSEIITVYTDNPTNPSGDPIIHPESVTGKEQRLSLDLGLHYDYGANEQAMGYFEIAGNFNAVKATQNQMHFGNLTYNLLLPPNPNNTNVVLTGGVGYGFMLGTGVRLRFNQKVAFDVGTSAYWQKIHLYENQKLRLNPTIYVRIVYI